MRLLLLLDLLAPGAARTDAEDLCRALEEAGHEVLAAVRGPLGLGPTGSGARPERVLDWPGLWEWKRLQRAFRPDAIVLVDGGGTPPRWRAPALLADAPFLRWPPSTGNGPTWGVDAMRATRGRLGLWDGDYVLSPVPLHSRHGAALLGAVRRLGEKMPQLDLVVLGPEQAALRRGSEELGISARVHFAGAAPREAEWAWLEHASAIVLMPPTRVSPGLILRSWAVGLPPIVGAATGSPLAVEPGHTGWLCPPEEGALEAALRESVARDGPAPSMAVESRRRAREMGWERVAEAIGRALGHPAAAAPASEPAKRAA